MFATKLETKRISTHGTGRLAEMSNDGSDTARAVESLIDDLLSPERVVRDRARHDLVARGSAVVEPLLEALDQQSEQHQWQIIPVLGAIGGSRAVSGLIRCLESTNTAIQSAAAQALGRTGSNEAVSPLLSKLAAAERTAAMVWFISALAQLGDKRAVGTLMDVLHRTDVPSVRYTASEALGLLGDICAEPDIMV